MSFIAGVSTTADIAGTTTFGMTDASSVSFGADFQNGSWNNVWNYGNVFTPHTPTWDAKAGVTAQLYVKPRLDIEFYTVVGPYLEVKSFVQFDGSVTANPTCWNWALNAGIEGNLGFQANILGANLFDYNTTLLQYQEQLASDAGCSICAASFLTRNDYPVGANPRSLISGDFNGDGYSDLIVANYDSNNLSRLFNNGNTTFSLQSPHILEGNPRSLTSQDFDNDGDADIAVTNSNVFSVLLKNGAGTFADGQSMFFESFIGELTAADFDGDGDYDIAFTNDDTYITVLLNNGGGTFVSNATIPTSIFSGPIIATDFDGDGDQDIVIAGFDSSTEIGAVTLLQNNGLGSFTIVSDNRIGARRPLSIVAADIDADGDVDIVTANTLYNSNDVSILFNNGMGGFQSFVNYSVGYSPSSVTVGDMDCDGDTDIITANTGSGTISVLLNNGNGTFASQNTYVAGNGPSAVISFDVDGDGALDIAIANGGSNSVSILLNQ